jgi:hypothetical protein
MRDERERIKRGRKEGTKEDVRYEVSTELKILILD